LSAALLVGIEISAAASTKATFYSKDATMKLLQFLWKHSVE